MPAPTATASLVKTGSNLVLTVNHSVLGETVELAGVVRNAAGIEAPWAVSVPFAGATEVQQAAARTWTKDTAASTDAKTVFTAPF